MTDPLGHDLRQIRALMHDSASHHTRLELLNTKLLARTRNSLLGYAYQPFHREELEYTLKYLCPRPRPAYPVGRIDAEGAATYSVVTVLALSSMTSSPVTTFQRLAALCGGIVLFVTSIRVFLDLLVWAKDVVSTRERQREWDEEYAVRNKLVACLFKMRLEGKDWSHDVP